MRLTWMATASAVLLPLAAAPLRAADTAPLTLESKIPLGAISGRIDHLAFDPKRARLYVAELGNDSVGIVDVKTRRLIRTVSGFDEPQGIAYEPITDSVYVANGGDGSVRVFSGGDFAVLGTISLGKDADNVHIDTAAHQVYVGYGNALAVIDPMTRKRVGDIPLKGHPEGFQLDPRGDAVFVNVPDSIEIAVVSRESRHQTASWPTGSWRANYPLAFDPEKGTLIAAFRRPAHLQDFDSRSGRTQHGIDICADADDVFVDARRRRVYVICGEGFVETLDAAGEAYTVAGRIATSSGSRTGLFVPEPDRLFVAIRAANGEPAAVWVMRPPVAAAEISASGRSGMVQRHSL